MPPTVAKICWVPLKFEAYVLCHTLTIVLDYKLISRMAGVVCFYSYTYSRVRLDFPHLPGFPSQPASQGAVESGTQRNHSGEHSNQDFA